MAKPLGKKKNQYGKPKLGPVTRDYTWDSDSYERTYTYTGDGGGKITVPVTRSGNIPRKVLVARFLDEESGTKPGQKKRNLQVDVMRDGPAYSQRSPQQWEWYRRPNKYDLKGIDEPKSNFFNTDAPKGDPDRGIVLIGPKKHTKRIAKHIDDSFTKKEKKQMNGLMIEVARGDSAGEGAAGYYVSAGKVGRGGKSDRHVRDIEYIKIGRDYTDDPKVTVHEVVHYMRKNDPERRGGLSARKGYAGTDRDFEEALTESEASVRIKKYQHGSIDGGYWPYVREIRNKEVKYNYKMAETIDRDILTSGKSKEIHKELYDLSKSLQNDTEEYNYLIGKDFRTLSDKEKKFIEDYRTRNSKHNALQVKLIEEVEKTDGTKGKLALRKVKKAFEKTKISTLKNYNKNNTTEAIDTYYKYEDDDGNIATAHFYSPDKNINQKKASIEAFGTTKNAVEFRDGKEVPLEEGYLNSANKRKTNLGPGKGWHGERMRHREASLRARRRK